MDIGSNTRISRSARIDKTNPKGIHIGSNTIISFGVSVLTHDFVNGEHIDTYIGDNCFIGGNAIIHPGVKIGDQCIIGAGSVVMNDIPSNTIAAGNPARLIRGGIKTREYGILENNDLEGSIPHDTLKIPPMSGVVQDKEIMEFIIRETGIDEAYFHVPVSSTGIDSFSLITLRTALEAHFGISISDSEWISAETLSQISNLPCFKKIKTQKELELLRFKQNSEDMNKENFSIESGKIDPPPPLPYVPQDRLTSISHKLPAGTPASMVDDRQPGRIHRRHMIEMSKMALSGLGEPWLFRELNDLHWALICDFLQSPSSQITDGFGDRLYATFTRCRIKFPSGLISFNENEPLDIHSDLERYGASVFFSNHQFSNLHGSFGNIEMMSTFAKYGERGKNKSLVKGSPKLPKFCSLPSMDEISVFGYEYRKRRAENRHEETVFMTEYEIQGPHDINGVGLLYFAAYPTIFDLCIERFEGKGFLRTFTTVSKDIMYFANAEPNETLVFCLHQRDENEDGHVQHLCSLSRKSDGVCMAEMTGVKRKIPIT